MTKKAASPNENGLPNGIGAPATRALNGAGITTLQQLTKLSEDELLALHGVGPKAIGVLQAVMKEQGLSFAKASGGK